MVRFWALLLVAALVGGCGLLPANGSRALGERFADALEGHSTVAPDDYMSPDATVYLQGGASASRQLFHDYIGRMKTSGQAFHRVGKVYLTPNGVGWLAAITRGGEDAKPSLWIEAAIDSGRITKVWAHFTLETLQSLHQAPATYGANMAALGLPLPDGWAQGTPEMLAAAERYDAQADTGPRLPAAPTDTPVLITVLVVLAAAAALRVTALRFAQRKTVAAEPAVVGQRNTALLASMREWRQTRSSPQTSIPV